MACKAKAGTLSDKNIQKILVYIKEIKGGEEKQLVNDYSQIKGLN